jgi:hypothetical protein
MNTSIEERHDLCIFRPGTEYMVQVNVTSESSSGPGRQQFTGLMQDMPLFPVQTLQSKRSDIERRDRQIDAVMGLGNTFRSQRGIF